MFFDDNHTCCLLGRIHPSCGGEKICFVSVFGVHLFDFIAAGRSYYENVTIFKCCGSLIPYASAAPVCWLYGRRDGDNLNHDAYLGAVFFRSRLADFIQEGELADHNRY